MSKITYIPDISRFEGKIQGCELLVEYREGDDPETEGQVLSGFDEVGITGFSNIRHCIIEMDDSGG